MTVADLLRALKKVKRDTIIVLHYGPHPDMFAAMTGIDSAECRKNVVNDDGSISEMSAECLVFYVAERKADVA